MPPAPPSGPGGAGSAPAAGSHPGVDRPRGRPRHPRLQAGRPARAPGPAAGGRTRSPAAWGGWRGAGPRSGGPRSSATSAGSTPRCPGRALSRLVDETFESYARYYEESFRLPGTSAADLDAGFSHEGYEHLQRGPGRRQGRHHGAAPPRRLGVVGVLAHPGAAPAGDGRGRAARPARPCSSGSWSCAGRSGSRSSRSGPTRARPPSAPSRPTTRWPSCATATSPAPAPRWSSSASARRCPAGPPRSPCAPARRSSPPPSTSTGRTPGRASCSRRSTPPATASSATTCSASRKTSPTPSRTSSAAPPSSGTSCSPTGHRMFGGEASFAAELRCGPPHPACLPVRRH